MSQNNQDPATIRLRAAVIEAAMRGLRPAPRQDRSNPFHKPNPQRDATTFFTARCKDVAEAFETHGANYLIASHFDDADLRRSIRYATGARDAAAKFLDAVERAKQIEGGAA